MKVLVLGHRGLLGNCVTKYLSLYKELEIVTTNNRWPETEFIEFVKKQKFDWIINGIAQIPQSKSLVTNLFTTNFGLPVFLTSLDCKIIHPSSNDLSEDTPYTLSKLCAEKVLKYFFNTYMIRCSIIGIEENTNKSLLSWFLNVDKDFIYGYENHYWNGITTLEWSKVCLDLINGKIKERLIIPFSDTVTKYEMLLLFKNVFEKDVHIIPTANAVKVIENTDVNLYRGNIELQLLELKRFYKL